ncbi:MAG: MBL fold metallo-hydrolase [Verrucomicrobiota bacterium]
MSSTQTPVEEVFEGGYLIQAEVGGRPLSLPLLAGETGTVLLDTGCASDVEGVIVPALRAIGLSPANLTHIVITHCDLDHQGGNADMKKIAPQAKIGCGRADAAQVSDPAVIYAERYDAYRAKHGHFYDDDTRDWIMNALGKPQPVDVVYDGGEFIEVSPGWIVEVIHLPGHSKGHLALWDKRHRALFAGDAIHGEVYLDLKGAPALCPTYLQVPEYLNSIRRIEELQPEIYSGCHWPVYRGEEVSDFCRRSREFVEKAESAILETLKNSDDGMGLTELCHEVGPQLGDWPAEINHELCYAFNGHLKDLVQRGLVEEESDSFPVRYLSVQ